MTWRKNNNVWSPVRKDKDRFPWGEYVFFVIASIALVGVVYSFAHQHQPAPAVTKPAVYERAYTSPDPCGLDVVECQGEQLAPQPVVREVTAYTSTVGQTDASPEVGADGTNILNRYRAGEGICASNAFPLGSQIDVAGYGPCTVADRMNSRYHSRVDVYFGTDTARALDWGKQNLEVTIL